MNKLWAVLMSGLCAACASTQLTSPGPDAPAAADTSGKSQPLYSAAESASLFGCSALTDSAMIIAEMKQKGIPVEQAKAYFAARPNSALTLATVDLVYDAAIGNVWDYAVKFFDDCAASVSKVPRSRSRPASFCMLNSMIAANAQASKQAGVPIEKVESYFAVFPGDMPKAIITRVYAQSQTRAAAHAEAWNSCMASLSGG